MNDSTTIRLDHSPLLLHNNNNSSEKAGRSRTTKSMAYIFFPVILGAALPILLPAIHMLIFYHLWPPNEEFTPNRRTCTCPCWDTVFKGPYETGVGSYKHVYFNATPNSFKMWAITVAFVIFLYEITKYVGRLCWRGRVRVPFLALLVASLHSHYYAWWGQWNYWNDEFYSQWKHQLFFTVTELVASGCVLSMLDRSKGAVSVKGVLVMGAVAWVHVCMAVKDNFWQNVVKGRGELHQVLRDLVLMTSDLLQLIVVGRELRAAAARKGTTVAALVSQRSHLVLLGWSIGGMLAYLIMCP